MIKKRKAYTTDVERESCDGTFSITRKMVFPELNAEELQQLIEETNIEYERETSYSLTLEFEPLPAKSYSCYDNFKNQSTNAYINIIFGFEGYENIDEKSLIIQRNYQFQEDIINEIFEAIDNEEWEELQDLMEEEFIYDETQLEIKFE
jgi:hypothetical protein